MTRIFIPDDDVLAILDVLTKDGSEPALRLRDRMLGQQQREGQSDLWHLMEIARRLDGWFAKRDVMRHSDRFMKDPELCGDTLQWAVELGWLRQRPGRQGPQWAVAQRGGRSLATVQNLR